MKIPPKVKTGDSIKAADYNDLIDLAVSCRVNPGAGIRTRQMSSGVTLEAIPRVGRTPADFRPFELVVTTGPSDTSETPDPKIRVIPSTLAGGSSTDLGFSAGDDPQYLLDPKEGVLIGGISWEPETGGLTTRWLEIQSSFPDPSGVADGTDYVEIGTIHWVDDDSDAGGHWTVTNSRFGPINATVCRNWWAAEAPFFTAYWNV